MPLTDYQVRNAKPGRHQDGNGLSLLVSKALYRGTREHVKKWVFRIQVDGERKDAGLGSARSKSGVTLAEAREAAQDMRRAFRRGENPIEDRKRARTPIPTFREAALEVYAENRPSWKNAKHAAQWISTLENYAFPKLGDLRIDEIDAAVVRDVLAEIWLVIPETARRVRQRIGAVLDYGHVKGWRDAETPTRSISRGLPRQPKKRGHFASMPWQAVPGFIADMPDALGTGETVRLAMEAIILTASRSGEARLCRWREIDLEKSVWTIPGERMKAEVEHRVPLSPRAVEIFERMRELRRTTDPSALIFEGKKPGKPFSDVTFTNVLRRAGLDFTMHGFRSTFRDWVSEQTSTPDAVAERALAHVEKNKTRRAYERSDLFERRRSLMNVWSAYCAGGSNVISIAQETA